MSARGQAVVGRALGEARRARAARRAAGWSTTGPRALTTVGLPVELRVEPAQRAQEQPQRAALLAVDEDAIRARRSCARGRPRPGRRRAARPGSRRGRSGASARRCASKLATRASSGRRRAATSLRATCVETTRSVGAWNVPTFSAGELRSAALATLGAHGSWTWTMSRGDGGRTARRPRGDVDRQRGAARRRAERERLGDREDLGPAADARRRRRAAAGACRAPRRASPTARRSPRGGPRRTSSVRRRARSPRLTSLSVPHG